MAISKKISELDVLTSPQDLTKLFPPLFAQDGSPLNIRMSMAEVLKSAKQITITDATVGTSTSILSIAPTWTTNGTYAAPLLVNVTDSGTANAASKLLDLQVSGSSKASFSKAGLLTFAGGSYGTTLPIMIAGSGSNGFAIDSGYGSAVIPMFYVKRPDGTSMLGADSNGLYVAGYLNLGTSLLSGQDCIIIRDAADRLAIRRSTNAQRFAVYRTWSAADNFERGVMSWYDSTSDNGTAGTVLRIGSEKGSVGGTARDVAIITDGTARVTFAAAGGQTAADGHHMAFGTSTGTKIGTATGQKIGFWNATPVVQQVLATGAGATVDNVITLLQTLGLCKQS